MTHPALPLAQFAPGTPRRPDLALVRLTSGELAPVAPAAGTDSTPVELTGLVVPYGPTAHRFGTQIVFEKGCLALPDDLSTVKLLIQHDDERPAGYAVAAADTDAGLRMTFRLADHPRAADLHGEVTGLLRDGLSVGVEPSDATLDAVMARFWGEDDGTDPIVFAGDLREVSAVSVPQFNTARADRAAAAAHVVTFTTERTPPMPTPATVADPPAPTPVVTHTTQPADVALAAAPTPPTLEELTDAVRARLGSTPAAGGHPLARFGSLSDYVDAVRDDSRLQLALVDQVTTDNLVLLQPAWLTEIIGILDQGSPVATALTAGGLPSSGMEINWPTYTGNYKTLVQKQATEKTGIHSEKVSIGRGGPAEVETFAGGSDVSYQLLRRSSPSYRDAYNRIMGLAYAWCTESVVSTYLVDNIGGWGTFDPATGDAEAFRTALFSASTKVWQATGQPATKVFVALDVFETLGGLDLYNPKYGTQNTAGTADAASLQISVNGLSITPAPAFAPGTIVVTNTLGARYLKDGPWWVTAEDVEKLGQNMAIWGMGAFLPLRPAGIIGLNATGTAPIVEGASAKSSSK